MADGRLRLTILGGYLGSGKTTWLRHHLHGTDRPPHVIVNEAAAVAVDDHLLRRAAGVDVLAGGCACCTARPGLVALLRGLCDARSRGAARRGGEAAGGIVLETSGLADPGPIAAAIRDDPVLVHHIVVTETIVLVDALHGLAQLAEDPLGRRQVLAADRLILTKTDAAPDAAPDLGRLIATLRALNPLADLAAADHGVACALPDGPPRPALALPPDAAGQGPMAAATLCLDSPVDWALLSLWLSALIAARGDEIVRIKGVVRTPAGRLLLQTVRRVVQSPEVLPEVLAEGGCGAADDTLVFLGRGIRADRLHRSWRGFAGD